MYRLLQIVCLILISSCSGRVSPEQYMSVVNDPKSGLMKSIKQGHFKMDIEYKTPEYMVLNEMAKNNTDWEESAFVEAYKEQQKLETFFIRFQAEAESDFLKQDLTTQTQYYERLNYFNGIVQQDIQLINGNDTLPCIYTYLERNYGVGPVSTLIVGFEKPTEKMENKTLLFNERVLGIGFQTFDISANNIADLPRLKL